MSGDRRVIDRIPPRQQTDWDIRGALNFVFGGAGGGLLAATTLAVPLGVDLRALLVLGLALVGAGLFCVWLKIGRPWRAMYVFRRASSSWMTREALIAPVLFACGAAAVLLQSTVATYVLGLLGIVFVYAQGRILKANIGIPAWRRWSCVAMIMATALTEGFGILCIAAPIWPLLLPLAYALVVLIVIRFAIWRYYLGDLRRTGAPIGTLKVLDEFEFHFVLIGHATAAVLAAAGLYTGQAAMVAVGGGLAAFAGALFKYTLVCSAAFKQGFALPHSPSRGKGRPGAGGQPGWRAGS